MKKDITEKDIAEEDRKEEDLSGSVALLGICCDVKSSFLRGAAGAPPEIRKALHDGSGHWTSETGVDLESCGRFVDLGDRQIDREGVQRHSPEADAALLGIEGHVAEVLARGALPLMLGGDHAITYPILRALAAAHGPLHILHFDAHADLYEHYEGDRLSHACPFARILEDGLAKRLVQVGIRTLNGPQKAQIEKYGVEVHEMRHLDAHSFEPSFDGPIYLSFDMDGLDPAYAPGVSHFEPGGLSVRDVLRIIHRIEAPILGADIVEYNPWRDQNGRTAMVAAKMLKEIAAMMLLNSEGLQT